MFKVGYIHRRAAESAERLFLSFVVDLPSLKLWQGNKVNKGKLLHDKPDTDASSSEIILPGSTRPGPD